MTAPAIVTLARVLSAPIRALVWTLDTCDPKGEPSLSKSLALAFGVVAARDAWVRGVSGVNVAAMALVLSAAFGRSVFMNWLSRWQMSHVATTAVSMTGDLATVAKAYGDARRDDERGAYRARDYTP